MAGVVLTGSPAYSFVSDSNTGMFTQNASAVTIQAVSSGTWFLPPADGGVGFSLNSAVWTFDSGSIPVTSVGPIMPYSDTGINGLIYSSNPYLNYNSIIQQVHAAEETKPEVEIDPTDIFEIF